MATFQRLSLCLHSFISLWFVCMCQALFVWWRERGCLNTETHLRRETFTSSLTSSFLKTTGLALKNWMWVAGVTHCDMYIFKFSKLKWLWCYFVSVEFLFSRNSSACCLLVQRILLLQRMRKKLIWQILTRVKGPVVEPGEKPTMIVLMRKEAIMAQGCSAHTSRKTHA